MRTVASPPKHLPRSARQIPPVLVVSWRIEDAGPSREDGARRYEGRIEKAQAVGPWVGIAGIDAAATVASLVATLRGRALQIDIADADFERAVHARAVRGIAIVGLPGRNISAPTCPIDACEEIIASASLPAVLPCRGLVSIAIDRAAVPRFELTAATRSRIARALADLVLREGER